MSAPADLIAKLRAAKGYQYADMLEIERTYGRGFMKSLRDQLESERRTSSALAGRGLA